MLLLYVNVCFVFLLIHTFAKDIAHKHKKRVLKTINICNMHAIALRFLRLFSITNGQLM